MMARIDLNPKSLVLVTGANGHVAQHVVSQLLARAEDQRPRVRGTVRSEQSVQALVEVFQEHVSAGQLEVVRVPDMTVSGAFDTALNGCTHIAHIASPLTITPKDTVNDLLLPAIRGTTSLLTSAATVRTIRAVVITSSFAACFDPTQGLRPGYTYTSSDWSPLEFDQIADPDLDLAKWPRTYQKFITYLASKKLSEKAAWDFCEKSHAAWQLTVINPTYIGGPCVIPLAKGPESFSYSNSLLWSIASSKPDDKLPDLDFPGWVDVRDVAKAHIQALITPSAANKRFLLAADNVTYSDIADIVRQRFPDLKPSLEIQHRDIYKVDAGEARDLLGIAEWIGIEKMVVDTVAQGRDWQEAHLLRL